MSSVLLSEFRGQRNRRGRHVKSRMPVCALLLCSPHSRFAACGKAQERSSIANEELTAKTRALYDAPFTWGLISYNCAVQFDWGKHFTEAFGSVSPSAQPLVERLQAIPYRVTVDHAGAAISPVPEQLRTDDVANAAELQRVFVAVVSAGLSAWLPAATNVLLPVGPTRSAWEVLDGGYKVSMTGPGVSAELSVARDMRSVGGVTTLPDPMRFTTEFKSGPNGFLLSSLTTKPTVDQSPGGDVSFSYTYQSVDGFDIPFQVAVTSARAEKWSFVLSDCQVTKGIPIHGLPYR